MHAGGPARPRKGGDPCTYLPPSERVSLTALIRPPMSAIIRPPTNGRSGTLVTVSLSPFSPGLDRLKRSMALRRPPESHKVPTLREFCFCRLPAIAGAILTGRGAFSAAIRRSPATDGFACGVAIDCACDVHFGVGQRSSDFTAHRHVLGRPAGVRRRGGRGSPARERSSATRVSKDSASVKIF